MKELLKINYCFAGRDGEKLGLLRKMWSLQDERGGPCSLESRVSHIQYKMVYGRLGLESYLISSLLITFKKSLKKLRDRKTPKG